jgi:hypothetical protein
MIRGKIHYLGPWDDPDGALAKYEEQTDALHAGKKPHESTDGATVKDVVNRLLNGKQHAVDSGELSQRTWACSKEACAAAAAAFGKNRLVSDLDPEDFASLRNKLAKRCGPHGLGTRSQSTGSRLRLLRPKWGRQARRAAVYAAIGPWSPHGGSRWLSGVF